MNKSQKRKLFNIILVLFFILFAYYYKDNIVSDKKDNSNNIQQKVKDMNDLKVYFVDVGQGDSILIEDNNKYFLIDAGNNNDGEKLVNYYKSLGISSFEYVVCTHPHEDHIGGMDDIINNFDVKNILMPNVITTSKTFEDVLISMENKNYSFKTPEIDSKINFEDCKFTVLYTGEDKNDLNNCSIVLKMEYGNTSYLLMGDATKKIEEIILDKDIDSDLLKVGHHGSEYSTGDDFLYEVSPKYAIISVGKGNVYNHPKDVTVNKLTKEVDKLYRTDLDHTIISISNGNDITFETISTNTNG